VLLLALALSSGPNARQEAPRAEGCVARIPIPLPLDADSGVRVVVHNLQCDESILGTLTLRNETGRALRGVFVEVNYLDDDGAVLFSIPYSAHVAGEAAARSILRPAVEMRLPRPVPKGQYVRLLGTNLLATTAFPTRAEVSGISLFFSDGMSTAIGYSPAVRRSDPLPVESTADLHLDLGALEYPKEIQVRLQIEPYGHVINVSPRGEPGLPAAAFERLAAQFRKWRFYPATQEGYAETSNLDLVLLFLPERALPVRRCFIGKSPAYPRSFAFVTLDPRPGHPGRWSIQYAGTPVSGRIAFADLEEGPPPEIPKR